MIEVPKLAETIRISKLPIPSESSIPVLTDGHELQYKLSYSDGESVYMFDCASGPDERNGETE